MSERTLKGLVGALAVALGLWVVATFVSGGSGSIAAPGDVAGFFDGADGNTVQAVRIVGPAETIDLQRNEGRWSVSGFPADSAAVTRLVEGIARASIGELVAANPDNHRRMGVSSDSTTTLEIDVDGEVRELYVGDTGPRFGTAFARRPGDDEVYLLEGDLRAQLGRSIDQWRDRTMARVDSSLVTRIEVERPGESYTLLRGDSAWALASGGGAASTVVDGVLAELAGLVASGFVADTDSIASLGTASATRAYDDAGTLLADITIGEGETDRWARTASNDYLYRVSAFRADRVAPPLERVEGGGS
jgi:hypothetical protein